MNAKPNPWRAAMILVSGLVAVIGCFQGRAEKEPASDEPSARIARVAESLQRPLLIEGTEIERWDVEDRMATFNVPAVSVAVIDQNRLAWAHAWGVIESGHDAPVTPETMFQAGSVSKPVAALLTLNQVGDGAVELDRPVNEVLQGWKVPGNEFTRERPVTLRHVLSHQAGFTPFGYVIPRSEGAMPGMAALLAGGIRDWPAITVEWVPGTRMAYSNAGYCVLQLMLEEISGGSLQTLAQARMFGPLGMHHSTFAEPLDDATLAAAACGHERKPSAGGGGREAVPVPGKAEMAPGATGGLWSTPTDLAVLAVEVMRALNGDSERIVTADLAHQFLTPQNDGMGLGISVDGAGRNLRARHGGSMVGFVCLMVFYPATGQGVVVMTNSDGGRFLQQELIAAIASEYSWPGYPVRRTLAEATADQLDELAGVYTLDASPSTTFTVSVHNGKAIGQINRYPPFELTPTTDADLYVLPPESLEIVFARDEVDRIVKIELRRAGDVGNIYSRQAGPAPAG